MARFREMAMDLARGQKDSIWISELVRPDLKPGSAERLEIVDACLDGIKDSREFLFVTDGNFGTHLSLGEVALESSFIEMELFQAALLRKPVHVIVIGEIDSGSPLSRLLQILRFAFPISTWRHVPSETEALDQISRVAQARPLRAKLSWIANRPQRIVGSLAKERHSDWANLRLGEEITFLDQVFDPGAKAPDRERIDMLLDEADRVAGSQRKLARVWLAIRELMGAPYWETTDERTLRQWERALGRWAAQAAWFGLHAHIHLGHLAGLGSVEAVRRRMRDLGYSQSAGNSHTDSTDGAFASCYYSLSKIAPPPQARHFLERAEAYVERGLAIAERSRASGLHAIRGSVRLRIGNRIGAVLDYERALRLARDDGGSSGRIGEMMGELGWAELHAGWPKEGMAHLREGVAILKAHADPGFVVRGRRKLAYGLARSGRLQGAFAEFVDAHDLAQAHQLEDQIDVVMRGAALVATRFRRPGAVHRDKL